MTSEPRRGPWRSEGRPGSRTCVGTTDRKMDLWLTGDTVLGARWRQAQAGWATRSAYHPAKLDLVDPFALAC